MMRIDRLQLYEKLYFSELDRREKINSRLSLPLAATLANVGLLSFMLNSANMPAIHLLGISFWFLFCGSASALLAGSWFFRKAWFGYTDKFLPTADQIESYHEELSRTYKEYENGEDLIKQHFGDFLLDYYKRCSSANSINNDQRSYNVYRANAALTIAVLLALAAAVPFYASRATLQSHPIETAAMTEQKVPPAPPPPPPERLVKDNSPKAPPPPPERP